MNNPIMKRTSYDWLMEIISWIGILYATIPICNYAKLTNDALVPVHFNMKGIPDSWGDEKHILYYSIISISFFILLSVLERNYKALNYPIKITENNKIPLYRLGVKLVRHLKLVITWLFAYLANLSFQIANGGKNDGQTSIIVFICSLFAILTIFAIRMFKLKNNNS